MQGGYKLISIAIDGPAGAGKSTIARLVAKKLGYIYIDTGALYRAIGLYALKNGVDPSYSEGVSELLDGIKLELKFENGIQRVILCGEDISEEIRVPEVSVAASEVSKIQNVRKFLLNLQKDIAEKSNVIMDGRDIGTVVLPNAQLKIFLTASVEVRAKRRYKELLEKGIVSDYKKVLEDMKKRDYEDSHREISPLVPACDAVILDTTNFSLEESASEILKIIKECFI